MKIIHKTPTRIRVKFDEISGKFQEADLQNQILALKGVKSVRINARIKCAIIECENTDEVALNLDEISPKPLTPDQMSCFCTHAQEVTKAQIVSKTKSRRCQIWRYRSRLNRRNNRHRWLYRRWCRKCKSSLNDRRSSPG